MSMRQWYPTANTNIPNDQKAFAEFCYGGMKSCKEGHEEAVLKPWITDILIYNNFSNKKIFVKCIMAYVSNYTFNNLSEQND